MTTNTAAFETYAAQRETSPSVVELAERPPSICCISMTDEGPFLDTGWWIPGWGRMYIALAALKDLYGVAGWMSRDKSAALRGKNRTLETENQALAARVADLEAAIDNLIQVTVR